MNQALLTLNWNWSAKGAVPFCAVRACEFALRNVRSHSLVHLTHGVLLFRWCLVLILHIVIPLCVERWWMFCLSPWRIKSVG